MSRVNIWRILDQLQYELIQIWSSFITFSCAEFIQFNNNMHDDLIVVKMKVFKSPEVSHHIYKIHVIGIGIGKHRHICTILYISLLLYSVQQQQHHSKIHISQYSDSNFQIIFCYVLLLLWAAMTLYVMSMWSVQTFGYLFFIIQKEQISYHFIFIYPIIASFFCGTQIFCCCYCFWFCNAKHNRSKKKCLTLIECKLTFDMIWYLHVLQFGHSHVLRVAMSIFTVHWA